MGESVTEGTITKWLKNKGDHVGREELLYEVSTDKVDTEIPSPVAGTLISIDVAVDSTVPVGARLAVIGGAGATPAPVAQTPPPAAPVIQTPPPAAPVAAATPPVTQPSDSYVTPIVRKLASELGVNLSTVTGTGIGGRIRREDIEAAAKPAAVSTPVASAPSAARTNQVVSASP
jgi:2-oxoglutarate dehydrogenase E2 component (dihydrolipoamide succinyltransferase)